MHSKIIFFLIQYIIYSNEYDFAIAEPMFGPNVRTANPGQYPFIVSLSRLGSRGPFGPSEHICTGSLVTKQDVLTAAHCFEDELIERIQVFVGSIDLFNGTRYDIFWWITYNEWARHRNRNLEFRVNDIAGLRLLDQVPNSIGLGIISPLLTSAMYEKDVVIAAWGRNELNVIPSRMRVAHLNVLTMHKCRSLLKSLNGGEKIKIHDRHICTIADPHAVMHWGDSGGPVLHNGMIIAIHKSTIPFPGELLNPRKINVHTTINYYREFATSIMNPNVDYIDI